MRFIFQFAFLHLQLQGFNASTSPRNRACVTRPYPCGWGLGTRLTHIVLRWCSKEIMGSTYQDWNTHTNCDQSKIMIASSHYYLHVSLLHGAVPIHIQGGCPLQVSEQLQLQKKCGVSARREAGREGGREEGREDCELISMLSNGFICLLGCMMYFTNLETRHVPLTDSF